MLKIDRNSFMILWLESSHWRKENNQTKLAPWGPAGTIAYDYPSPQKKYATKKKKQPTCRFKAEMSWQLTPKKKNVYRAHFLV